MASLNEIKAPVEHHITEFEKKFRDSMRSSVPLLDRITAYLVKRKGKQIRPLFVFLTAEVSGGINETTYRAASLIELLHTATLIHDDVVDDSNERRGFFSLNALWKNKISVLIGDFLLSKGLLLSLENDDFELLRIVSDATREMSEGELLQIEKARRLDIQEDVYFEIIRKKTASLIASCCASGAASAGADKETISRLHRFGELTGIAFQIKDDLFDYSKSLETGKPNGIDIKEKKMTLPLIYLLNNSGWVEKRRIINTVKHHNDNPVKVASLIQQVKEAGGIAYAEKQMLEYRNQAIELLHGFEPSPARKSLEELVIFTTERKH
ncbi:MAG: octaprenyl-diphosphate synthase [Bacteroidetes bacterium]|nr:MAG: octaprenyl-diphosphate synthase [Bacteroidota bacterium]